MNPTARILICAALAACIAALAAPQVSSLLPPGVASVIALAAGAALNRLDSVTGSDKTSDFRKAENQADNDSEAK
jgi:hypothetical protein